MSKFINSIFMIGTGKLSYRQQPVSLVVTESTAYSDPYEGVVNDYRIEAAFRMEARVPAKHRHEMLESAKKALTEHVYGDLRGMLHELQYHVQGQHWEEAQHTMRDILEEVSS